MWFALNLRQEVAHVLVAAFRQGLPALSEMDLAEALEQRGLVVEVPTVTAILDGLETRGCLRLNRVAGEVVVAEIYLPIAQFLAGGTGPLLMTGALAPETAHPPTDATGLFGAPPSLGVEETTSP